MSRAVEEHRYYGVLMGNVILFISVSLDGYFEGPDHDISWSKVDAELHQDFNDVLRGMAGLLTGRVTHELMAEVWPTMDEDSADTPEEAEFAGIWRDLPKIVYSRTQSQVDWSTAVRQEIDVDEIAALEGDWVVGGPDLAAGFSKLGLIDEYWIHVHPVLIGQGKPLFPSSEAMVDLQLVETRAFGNGVVRLRYKRSAPKAR